MNIDRQVWRQVRVDRGRRWTAGRVAEGAGVKREVASETL